MRSQVSMKKHAWLKLTCFYRISAFEFGWEGGFCKMKYSRKCLVQHKSKSFFLSFSSILVILYPVNHTSFHRGMADHIFQVFCQKPEHLRLFPTQVPSCRCLECRPTRNISLLIFQQRQGQIQVSMTSNVLLISWQIDLPWLRSFQLYVPWE